MTPLLSICIPTYNRAHLLESALYSLAPQVAAVDPDVELIVSDNCSTDNTPEIVRRAGDWGPIRYHRNEQNIGAARNIMRLTNELATGEFAWMIGDDDLVRPGGVARVIAALESNPDVDYVFVNFSPKSSKERHSLGRPVTGSDFPELLPTRAKSLVDRRVERWEELIDPDVDNVFLGSFMASVFRLSCWKEYDFRLEPGKELWSSLEDSYLLSVVLAHTMLGKRAYYIGYPCVIAFWGDQEWIGAVPLMLTVRLQELLDLYRRAGVEPERVERCRHVLLRDSTGALRTLLSDPKAEGREHFSLARFIWQNRRHSGELGKILAPILSRRLCLGLLHALPAPVCRALRMMKRLTMRALAGR